MKIVVFSGAGMSADSGIKTFRDSGGLWENYRIEDVATPEAFANNPQLVLDFYNMRVADLRKAKPNAAHLAIARLEEKYEVEVVTQNVDDLHERAGSSKVLHLHGELTKCRSTGDETDIYPMPEAGLMLGDLCKNGFQLRPHIVWFGELVPAMDEALKVVRSADLLLIVGTSLQVYPAAGLAFEAPQGAEVLLVDPGEMPAYMKATVTHIKEKAAIGVPKFVEERMGKI
ncbi:MAG: NAD-dependent deacetylase [Cryomorphaceae bacterium]